MKKKIALLMAAVMLFGVTVGATIAYLTSTTQIATNTFTSGDIKIILNEEDVDESETTVYNHEGKTKPRDIANEYKLYPGDEHVKDPMVSVRTDSEESYVRMLVTVEGYDKLLEAFDGHTYGEEKLPYVKNGVFLIEYLVTGWNPDVWVFAGFDATTKTYEFRYHEAVNVTGETGVAVTGGLTGEAGNYVELEPLFETIKVPGGMDDTDVAALNNVTINVVAHAIQTKNFTDAADAWSNW